MAAEERTATQIAGDLYILSIHRKLWMGVYSTVNITPFPFLKITITRNSKDLGNRTESKFLGKLGGTSRTLKSITKS